MTGPFIARDPRTGLPLSVASKPRKQAKIELDEGPWMALKEQMILPLASGELESTDVRWRGKDFTLYRADGIKAFSMLHGSEAWHAYPVLIESCMDENPKIRIAALSAIPHLAQHRSGELFDHLSVMLDDPDARVRVAASKCLGDVAGVFPSATIGTLELELRAEHPARRKEAWRGLSSLCEIWVEVACDHLDLLLQEDEVELRRSAASLIRKILRKGGAASWDILGWALEDEDNIVRQRASKTLVQLANIESRVAIILAERSILDKDERVRNNAVKCLEKLDSGDDRVKRLILNGAKHHDPSIRLSCVNMLPKLLVDEALVDQARELLQNEKDAKVRKRLEGFAFDSALEGSETEKNRALAPAEPVPQITKDIENAFGKRPLSSNKSTDESRHH